MKQLAPKVVDLVEQPQDIASLGRSLGENVKTKKSKPLDRQTTDNVNEISSVLACVTHNARPLGPGSSYYGGISLEDPAPWGDYY